MAESISKENISYGKTLRSYAVRLMHGQAHLLAEIGLVERGRDCGRKGVTSRDPVSDSTPSPQTADLTTEATDNDPHE